MCSEVYDAWIDCLYRFFKKNPNLQVQMQLISKYANSDDSYNFFRDILPFVTLPEVEVQMIDEGGKLGAVEHVKGGLSKIAYNKESYPISWLMHLRSSRFEKFLSGLSALRNEELWHTYSNKMEGYRISLPIKDRLLKHLNTQFLDWEKVYQHLRVPNKWVLRAYAEKYGRAGFATAISNGAEFSRGFLKTIESFAGYEDDFLKLFTDDIILHIQKYLPQMKNDLIENDSIRKLILGLGQYNSESIYAKRIFKAYVLAVKSKYQNMSESDKRSFIMDGAPEVFLINKSMLLINAKKYDPEFYQHLLEYLCSEYIRLGNDKVEFIGALDEKNPTAQFKYLVTRLPIVDKFNKDRNAGPLTWAGQVFIRIDNAEVPNDFLAVYAKEILKAVKKPVIISKGRIEQLVVPQSIEIGGVIPGIAGFSKKLQTQLEKENANPDPNDLLYANLLNRTKAFSEEAKSQAGFSVNSYEGLDQIFDSVSSSLLLSELMKSESGSAVSGVRNQFRPADDCLRISYFLQDIDQAIKFLSEDRYAVFAKELKARFGITSVDDSKEILRKKFERALPVFIGSCLPSVRDFFANNQSKPYQKNWVHIQKIILAYHFRSGKIPEINHAFSLNETAIKLPQSKLSERELNSHLLEIGTPFLSAYAFQNVPGFMKYAESLQVLVKGLRESLVSREAKSFIYSSLNKSHEKVEEAFVNIFYEFARRLSYAESTVLFKWLTDMEKLIEESDKLNEQQKIIQKNLIHHYLSVLHLYFSDKPKIADQEIVNKMSVMFKTMMHRLKQGPMQNYEMRSWLQFSRNTLQIVSDSTLIKDQFEAILGNAEQIKSASPENMKLLKVYLEDYVVYMKQNMYRSPESDRDLDQVKKQIKDFLSQFGVVEAVEGFFRYW